MILNDSSNNNREVEHSEDSKDGRRETRAQLNSMNSTYTIDESLFRYLENIEVEQLTPIESMNTLYQIVNQFKNRK